MYYEIHGDELLTETGHWEGCAHKDGDCWLVDYVIMIKTTDEEFIIIAMTEQRTNQTFGIQNKSNARYELDLIGFLCDEQPYLLRVIQLLNIRLGEG